MPASTTVSAFARWEVAIFLAAAFIWVQVLLYVLRIVADWQLARAAQQQQREYRAALAVVAQQQREWLEMMNSRSYETAIQVQEPAVAARRGAEHRAQLRRELEADLARLEEMNEQDKLEE
ncbi:uncharacterized protein EKO05_0008008 [Ascochyta rabiei]|uniref:Uncharacterized protein n=1 Tax=Didymella rabiei TaxID=5454 RepID=A0A163B9Q5_DIDRA|nr:uncharacterized protein EKO05_0008008 [Ascochyta rabiei]KZM21644.1 hypothetical protein ST47_g7242 [Ascochyta rabiei]UPX17667.1 hypothetical protein EKO05_0008008 [Ascochyta rabiei]